MAIVFLDEEVSEAPQAQKRRIVFLDDNQQEIQTETQEPVGTSIGQEISQLPAALKQSFGQPLEAIGETAQVAGFPAVATALKGAIQEPEGYVSAGQRFMEPQEGEFQVAGFAPQYAPRAIAEQTGQILGSIGSRIAGAVTLGGLGALISPATGVAGVAAGQFAGPALFEAAQIVGPVALERAKNNGYTEPTDEDMAYAITTAAGSGLLNAFGAKYLPGGEKAVGSFSKRLAASFIGEGIPEGLQSLVQQVGETIETKKGIQVNPKQAVGEALIGGGAGAAATIASAPFTPEQIEEQKITERANKEAENLVIGNDNPQGKAVLANKQKLEQEIADTKQVLSAIESTDPVAQKLKLELKEKEAILAAAQGQVDSIVDSNNPVVEAKKQQIELAKQIAAPAEEVAPVAEPVTPAAEAPAVEAAPVEPAPPVTEAPAITPAPVEEVAATKAPVVTEKTALEIVPQEVLEAFSENQPIMERIRKDALEKRGGSLQTYITASVRTKGVPKSQIQPITNKILKQFQESGLIADIEEAVTNEVENISSIKEKKKSDEIKLQAALQRTGETYELDTAIQDYKNKQIELERAQKSMLITPALRQMERVGAKNNLEKSKQTLISIAATPAVSETITPAEEAAPVTTPAPAEAVTPTTAEPAGIAIGNRVKTKTTPQSFVVEEVLPQSAREAELGEQYYRIKNERTGEMQTVEANDIRVVRGKGMRKLFAGEKAEMPQFRRDSLDAARAMAATGKTPEEIRAVTGWFPGKYDKKMRWEIPDQNAKLTTEAFLKGQGEPSFESLINKYYNVLKNQGTTIIGKLSDILNHKELYDLYPDLKNIEVVIAPLKGKATATFIESKPQTETSFGNPDTIELNARNFPKDLRSTLLHEIQHAIQKREGFARGASSETSRNTEDTRLAAEMALGIKMWMKDSASKNLSIEEIQRTTSNPNRKDLWPLARELVSKSDKELKKLTSSKKLGFEGYKKVAGEIEARDIQARRDFTQEQLFAIAPYSSENIAPEEAIILTGSVDASSEVRVEEKVQPVPEADRYTFDEAGIRSIEFFGGKAPDGLLIVNDTTNPNYEMKAGYDPETGDIILNRAYIKKGESIEDILTHELGHYIFSDPKFQADFKKFWELMTPEEKAKADQIINQFYNKETGAIQMEEKQVRAFMQLIQDSKAMPKWKQILDKIKRWINEKLGTNLQVNDRGALSVLAAAHKRFKSGEQIIREIDSGMLKTAETAQDADYLAVVERGDMETAQRMVDEAAKRAGYGETYYHGTSNESAKDIRQNGIDQMKSEKGYFGRGFYMAEDRKLAQENYADFSGDEDGDVVNITFPKKSNILDLRKDLDFQKYKSLKYNGINVERLRGEDNFNQIMTSLGIDGLIDESFGGIVLYNESIAKSADPVTYDDAGNVIPLSQRFQPSEPDIRRMAVEPTPIEPEAKTITEGLVQGIDIGKETNMPINNKIESHIKNFAFVRGIFESASDRLRRAKFTKLATAIDDYYDQAQRRLGFANKILLPAFDEYSKQSKSTKKKIDEEVKMFFAAQENKRDTAEFFDELNPITQKIVTAWQKFGEESGKENQRIGIKVFDRGLQRWRPIGRVEKFWPRVLKPEYKRALMEPDKYQKEYNEIVEALMKSGRINTPEEAEVFISDYQGTGSQNDYFSGIEAARGQAFPEELYDYSMQVMTDYVARWVQHSSRIEQFGQKLGENSKTLWDRSRESTRDRRTIDYITAAQERVEGYYPNDPIVKGMATLNIWASGLQLGNPASSMLNFFGGTTFNAMVGQPGALSSYVSSFVELRKLGRELKDAREKGIVSRDLMNIVGDHQAVLDSSGLAKAGQKTTDFLLKWSGFTPVEQMVRTQSMIIGKSFLRKTLSSLSKNPNSSFSKRALTWLNRNNIDADKLIVEQGTGPETDRLLRYFANISQGSYTIAQTPIFTDTPIGRFLFKYQKFSTQVMRQSWKNTFEPAWRAVTNKNETLQLPDPTRQLLYRLRLAEAKELGDNRKITLDEIPKKVTKAEGKALTIIPVMMWLGASYVGGEVILRLRDMLFGVLMKGPDYEDIIRAFEDDEDDDELYLSLERAWYNLIGMGALGLIGNYAQFFMDWQDRERVKNPLDPPALSIFKETATFIQNAVDQGKITVGDVNNYLNRTFSAYRVSQRLYQTAASGLGYSDAPTVAEEMFRREVASINKYARRWAESAGLEYRTKRPMDIAPSKMTPINREIAGYLQRGEPGAAAAYAKEYLNSLPKKERANAIQSMESGARNRQPLRLGSGPMDQAEKIAFKKWLKEKVSKEKFDEIQKLESQYQKNYNIFLNNLPNK